jgi:hypothetical protein
VKYAIDFMNTPQGTLCPRVELHIDDENSSNPAESLESSMTTMSTYDSMMQTLTDELNDRAATDAMDAEFEDLDFFNMDCATAMSFDYEMNHTMKQLKHIAGYYGMKCKSKKADMIQDIVAYEIDAVNCDIVSRRKRMFHYMNALKTDDYFKSFVLM